MAHAFRSSRVVLPEGIRPAALIVQDGVITEIVAPEALGSDMEVTDFGENAILPGLIDVHTHINEPGRTEWEGFETATRAAAAGGFVALVDMPLNCLPETTTVDALQQKRIAARGQTYVDWLPWGGLVGPGDDTTTNINELEPLAAAGVPGFKCFLLYPGCEGLTHLSLAQLEHAAPILARLNRPLLVHAELEGPVLEASSQLYEAKVDWSEYSTYLASRPDEAELAAIRALLDLCRRFRFPLHIVHLATAQALPMLAEAKAEGLPLTVETCPHYLCVHAEQIPAGETQFKCAPPIRSQENQDGLWHGVRNGTIDLIATDHSPCPPAMKPKGPFDKAWGGIASLSTAVVMTWTEAQKRGFTLQDLARWFSLNPAKLAGLSATHGALEAGRPATFTVFAPESTWTITEDRLYYRHPISPYVGCSVSGEVVATYLRGESVFAASGQTAEFAMLATGRDLSFCPNAVLAGWNHLPEEEAIKQILPTNGSFAWAEEMVSRRPYTNPAAVFEAADEVWSSLLPDAQQQAFDSHPRIGERHAVKSATEQSLAWSSQEQTLTDDEAIKQALAQGNVEYETRFGRIFIVCATGKTQAEMLQILRQRLKNDPAEEFAEAAEQQRQITQLRLRKWMGSVT